MSSNESGGNDLGLTLGMLTLRIWLAMRSFQTGLEKYAGMKADDTAVELDGEPNTYGLTEETMEKTYSFSDYHGVPAALADKFAKEPLIPGFFLKIYDATLGPILIILGITLLIGICTRFTLFAMGLVYCSLTFGLILIKQDAGVAWLGIHIIMVVLALTLARYNRLAIMNKF
ncbi:MAG: hypothetical protein AAFX93_16220 [Verrucomicrobiota bacterium]